ncbi:DUF2993 domain-containing protein [Protofrankia sp. BMG5.30]|uniref:LmeA family phospholipid-binding protein n=1 Tax=Protofrankia sp. BMG5.30 TaxID=1834514 RepID=UPI00069BD10D|nr:DUF2993 domain-containing protein [Protofrankia sp. BMG5.30]
MPGSAIHATILTVSTGHDNDPDVGSDPEESTRRLPPSAAAAGAQTQRARVGPVDPPPPADSFRPAPQPGWSGPGAPPGSPAQPGPSAAPAQSAAPIPPTSAFPPPEGSPYGSPPYTGAQYGGPPYGGQPPLAPTDVTPGPVARRRRRRWPIVTLVVLIILLVVADRAAVPIAESQMKAKAEASVAQSSTDPGVRPARVTDVSIGGFPFLTQVLFGKYDDLRATVTDIPTPGPRITEVKARLQGVHVPFWDAIRDQVKDVPVDKVTADVQITYDDLNAYLATQNVKITPVDDGREVRISGEIDTGLLGTQELSGTTRFGVQDNTLTLIPTEILGFRLPGVALPGIPLPISNLPFNLQIEKAATGKNGISVTATATNVVLPAEPTSAS